MKLKASIALQKICIHVEQQDTIAQVLEKIVSKTNSKQQKCVLQTSDGFALDMQDTVQNVLHENEHVTVAVVEKKLEQQEYYPAANCTLQVIDSALAMSLLDQFSLEEQVQRVQLAACYRLFDHFGWTDTIYGHLSAKAEPSNEKPHFLINAMGLLYSEMTASSLVKLDLQGEVVHAGATNLGINKAGYVIHSAVHEARKDIKCVMHSHFADAAALSCIEQGLLPVSQTSQIIGNIAYHDYEGIAVDEQEKQCLQKDLGTAKILILRNHGVVTCGATIAEAFFLMYTLLEACKIQVKVFSHANANATINIPAKEIQHKTNQTAMSFMKEGFGARELSAYMRMLDRKDQSYKL